MNFDRNTVFGFIALAVLFLGYFFYNNRGQQQMLAEKARQDSIARANQPESDTISQKRDSSLIDSQNRVTSGGHPKWVELKNFKAPDSNNVRLAATDFDKITYSINTGNGRTGEITNFYFS